MDRDRNLLFGIFAAHFRKVTSSQITAAAAAWAKDPSRDLPDILVEAGALSQQDRVLLEDLVESAVQTHHGDGAATLVAFGGPDQVAESFRNTIALTESGGVATRPCAMSMFGSSAEITALEETPGRYSILREYARGGMGRIYLAHDENLKRDIALKELLPDPRDTKQGGQPSPVRLSFSLMSRFLQEARITGQLEHPSIVPVYELGNRKDGTPYYTMKLVRGRTMLQAIREGKTLQDRLRLLPHFVDLCQALAYAHSRGVIHRDIKPGNVMVGEFGETVVLDWGLAKIKGGDDVYAGDTTGPTAAGEDSAAKTAYGQALGTPAYMPPEQAEGRLDEVDERSDVYSLGAVLYELLTGQTPFTGSSVHEILRKVITSNPSPIRSIVEDAPPELCAISVRALEKDPAKRYASAKELADDVERFMTGALVWAYEYRFTEHLRRFIVQHTAILSTVAASVVLLLSLGVYSYVRIVQEKRVATEQRDHAQQELYFASIGLADRCSKEFRMAKTRALLAGCPQSHRGWEWDRLHYLCNLDVMALVGNGKTARCLALGPDGSRLATGNTDGSITLWNAATGGVLLEFPAYVDAVSAVAFSPDGNLVATGGMRNPLAKIWDAATGRALAVLEGHGYDVNSVAFSPDGTLLATGSGDTTVRLWEASSGRQEACLEGHSTTVSCVRFSPDGRFLVSGSTYERKIMWRDMQSREQVKSFDIRKGSVVDMEFSRDGTRFAAACEYNEVVLWRVPEWTEMGVIPQNGQCAGVAFSPDGSRIAIGHAGHTVLWDMPGDRALFTVRAPGDHVAFTPDGSRLASIDDGQVRFWDTTLEPRELLRLKGHTNWAMSVAFSPDGKRVASSGRNQWTRLWDVETGRELAAFPQGEFSWTSAFTPDGKLLTVAGDNHMVKLVNTETGREEAVFPGHEQRAWALAVRPDGRQVAAGGGDGTVRIWDVATQREVRQLGAHGEAFWAVAYSPNGKYLAAGSQDCLARMWDADTGEEVQTFAGHKATVTSVAFNPQGTSLATAADDTTVRIWDIATGRERFTCSGHTGSIPQVTFSPDGRRLASCGQSDAVIRIWDVETGRELLSLDEHKTLVNCVAFSPDGRLLASGGADGTILIRPTFPWSEKHVAGPDCLTAEQGENLKRAYWEDELQKRREHLVNTAPETQTANGAAE